MDACIQSYQQQSTTAFETMRVDADRPTTREISVDDAIDRIGMGRFQYGIMVAAGLCFAADAMEILLLSFLSLVLKSEWNLTDRQTSLIAASVFAGSFVGTLALGRLGDAWGRRPVFLLTAAIVSVFGAGTALVHTYEQLVLCRMVVGVGVGGLGVVYDTLAEFMPTQRRGERLVYTSFFWTFATMLVPVFAYLTLGQQSDNSSNDSIVCDKKGDNQWRLFVICCAVPCVVSTLVTVFAVPESPRWLLAKQKDHNRALNILRRATETNGMDPEDIFPPGKRLESPSETEAATFCDLLSPHTRTTTLLLWAVWGTYALMYYGTIITVALVFYTDNNNSNDESRKDSTCVSYHFDYLAMIVSSSAEVVGVCMILLTVDRFGRIACQMAFFSIGGTSLLALCMLSASDNSYRHRILLVILAFLARMFVYSGSNVVWITTAELLPTEIRTTSHSVANSMAKIGAFAAPYLVSTSTPIVKIGLFMMVVSMANVFCSWHLPETSGRPMGLLRTGTTAIRRRGYELQQVPTKDMVAA